MMQTTTDYVWVAILVPLVLWLLTRSGGFQSKGYKRANGLQFIAWIAVILLALWIVRRIVMPSFFY